MGANFTLLQENTATFHARGRAKPDILMAQFYARKTPKLKTSPLKLQEVIGLLAQLGALGPFVGEGYEIFDSRAGPLKPFSSRAHVPRKDQRGAVCSQVVHGSSHSQDTFSSPLALACGYRQLPALSWAHKIISEEFLLRKLSLSEQTYKLTWKPALRKYKTQSNT